MFDFNIYVRAVACNFGGVKPVVIKKKLALNAFLAFASLLQAAAHEKEMERCTLAYDARVAELSGGTSVEIAF